MNITQKQVILMTVFLLNLFVVFPPWVYENSQTSVEYAAGYHFYYSPPKIKSDEEMRKQFSIPDKEPVLFHAKRDKLRSTAQILVLAFFSTAFLWIFAGDKQFGETIAITILIIGGSLFTVMIYLLN